MTTYIPAYDLESMETPTSALETIVKIHKKYDAPATFFVVGSLLEENPNKYRTLLGDELFDIESHTYSHKLLKDHLTGGRGVSLEKANEEVAKASKLLKATFKKKILGLRTPWGFYKGLQGEKRILRILWENGIRFVSSDLMGPFDTVPAPLTQPYWYKKDGFPELLELPGHDWHDNVLKGYAKVPTLWPPIFPWSIPQRIPETSEEEFGIHKPSIDYAIEQKLIYYSPVFHPSTIYRFDPEAGTIDLLLRYAKKKEMQISTYYEMYERIKEGKASACLSPCF